MQLTIIDETLCIRTHDRMIYAEQIDYRNVRSYLITCGYRPQAAQAIAYGALHERQSTITLAQTLKLIKIST